MVGQSGGVPARGECSTLNLLQWLRYEMTCSREQQKLREREPAERNALPVSIATSSSTGPTITIMDIKATLPRGPSRSMIQTAMKPISNIDVAASLITAFLAAALGTCQCRWQTSMFDLNV
jgi:hypothetical protein